MLQMIDTGGRTITNLRFADNIYALAEEEQELEIKALSLEQKPAQDDGLMTCDFTSFSIVFQSYQDNGRVIKAECNGTRLRLKRFHLQPGSNPGPLDQLAGA